MNFSSTDVVKPCFSNCFHASGGVKKFGHTATFTEASEISLPLLFHQMEINSKFFDLSFTILNAHYLVRNTDFSVEKQVRHSSLVRLVRFGWDILKGLEIYHNFQEKSDFFETFFEMKKKLNFGNCFKIFVLDV